MSDKLTKTEREQMHPLVIQDVRGKFLVAGQTIATARWSEEYPDARKFKPTGEKREAVKIAGEVGGKVIANCGQNDEEVIADCTPKPWIVRFNRGPVQHLNDCNASEITDELPDLDDDVGVIAADRVLYDDGTPVSADDHAINEAVRTIIRSMGELGKSIVLLSDKGNAPYILPVLINEAVEYQVSDGIDGKRGASYDAYTWSEAVKYFEQMREELSKRKEKRDRELARYRSPYPR